MSRRLLSVVAIGAFVFGLAGAAQARPTPPFDDADRGLPSASPMADGDPTLAPLAFVQFCMTYAGRCRTRDESRISLSSESWKDLQTVNATVNGRIAPNAGKGGFDWSLNTRYGNCNDYAVQKRQELIDRGYPANALSLAAAITPAGEGHLVLTVRTDRGDFVLDNLRQRIVPWHGTGYRWLKRQSAERPEFWVSLSAEPTTIRAAQARTPAKHPAQPPAAQLANLEPAAFDSWVIRTERDF